MGIISALLSFLFKFHLLDSVSRREIALSPFTELGKDIVAKDVSYLKSSVLSIKMRLLSESSQTYWYIGTMNMKCLQESNRNMLKIIAMLDFP